LLCMTKQAIHSRISSLRMNPIADCRQGNSRAMRHCESPRTSLSYQNCYERHDEPKGWGASVQRYFFTIRGRDRVEDDPDGTSWWGAAGYMALGGRTVDHVLSSLGGEEIRGYVRPRDLTIVGAGGDGHVNPIPAHMLVLPVTSYPSSASISIEVHTNIFISPPGGKSVPSVTVKQTPMLVMSASLIGHLGSSLRP